MNTGTQIIQPAWIGLDWGTTNLRAFAMNRNNNTLAVLNSGNGMDSLQPDEFERALVDLIELWLKDDIVTPVIACGMVGARQGWQEASYQRVPCQPIAPDSHTTVRTRDHRIALRILPGLCQWQPGDVMRGEETQIAGLLNSQPGFDGVVCLPGTHSKWAVIQSGLVMSFSTYMTGELYSLLCNESVLRHSVNSDAWDAEAFMHAAITCARRPEQCMGDLFSIRASSLLHDTQDGSSRSRLSGMLIGYELGITVNLWQNNNVVLIGAPQTTALYEKALRALDVEPLILDAQKATIAGLCHAKILQERNKP